MKDLTELFLKGIEYKSKYDSFTIIRSINSLEGIFCDYDDCGANWEIIFECINEKSTVYGFVSVYYPVALLKENCPQRVINELQKNGIFIECFDEPFSCSEEVLKKYAPAKRILDDRFLNDCNFSLNDDRLFYIYENLSYVTPYDFIFDEIR